jgi:hypothetical protein
MRNQLFAFVDAPKKFVRDFCFCVPFFDDPDRDLVDFAPAVRASGPSDALLAGLSLGAGGVELASCSSALTEAFAFALPFAGATDSSSSSSTDSYEE